ncbi:uncharacterized protein LOC143007944 [Genypterus blacodes]|uniref:uncharacterized protein LOC143007944 n=1 Tax=Genypterus blacodes TaxID=154954 RepID=UPI003F761B38
MAVHRNQCRGDYTGTLNAPQLSQKAGVRKPQWCHSILSTKRAPPEKQRTMEAVRSAFHAQLATVMDSLLAAAVCEIAKIFESSLCEQQAELAQKTQEISSLRGKLEKVERMRLLVKAGGAGEEGDRDGQSRPRQQSHTGSGQSVGKAPAPHADPVEGLSQGLVGMKEEATVQDGASVKHERSGSRPTLGSVAVQTPEGSLAAVDPLCATQAKAKLSHWDQGSRSADHQAPQEPASAPFLSISQSGRCSPRPDPSLAQPGDWLPGLDPSRGSMSGLENLQADGTHCSGPASTDAPCFRPGFVSDETSNEDDGSGGGGSFPFLDQGTENQNSDQNSAQGQGAGQRHDPSQAPSVDSLWRSREERGGRGAGVPHSRRTTSFSNRDPLRPQSNTQSLTLRHANTLNHPAAPGGGSGRPYTCPYCTKCFTYPSHQRRHLLRHTGVRLHPCQFCDKSFLTPSELTVHTRTHTGERPFGCAQCGKRFARSGNLRAHQRDVHMGKRPFACSECGKRFAHRGNLRVHNHRVHQGDPYYMDDQQEPDIGPNPI